jgi:uncharacterized membrane protein YesL
LFLLNLLWFLGTLVGGVLLGIFPATAAVHDVLRRDQMDRIREDNSDPTPARLRLWQEFWTAWRASFRSANLLGLVLALCWALLAVDRVHVRNGVGTVTPWISGVIIVVTVVLAMATLIVWPIAAHYSDRTGRLVRMTLAMALSRPLLTVFVAMISMTWLWLLQAAPGVCVVFGVALPFWATTALYWRSGVFPLPETLT